VVDQGSGVDLGDGQRAIAAHGLSSTDAV
jgi:hypothetical protein